MIEEIWIGWMLVGCSVGFSVGFSVGCSVDCLVGYSVVWSHCWGIRDVQIIQSFSRNGKTIKFAKMLNC